MNGTISEIVADLLEHHGVKGMKWGVRGADLLVSRGLGISTTANRRREAERTARRTTPQPVVIRDKRKRIRTSGGSSHPAHPDAIRARALGQVGKKSGLKALSNQELQAYANRLQLEQNVKRLNYNDMNAGKKFVANVLGKNGNALASEGVNKGTKEAGRKALTLIMKK